MLLTLFGCAGEGPSDSGSCDPSIELVSPADGDTVCGSPLVIEATVSDFELTNEEIDDPPPCIGHLHVYLNGQEAAQADKGRVEVNDVADGTWQLRLDLQNADHTALTPYVGTDPVYITVAAAGCSQ